MTTLDSDTSIVTRGIVLSLMRGIPGRLPRSEDDLVTLVIQSDAGQKCVDLPIHTRSEFEILPYHASLVGADVRYIKKWEAWEEGTSKDWMLEILSGPLQGNVYRHHIS